MQKFVDDVNNIVDHDDYLAANLVHPELYNKDYRLTGAIIPETISDYLHLKKVKGKYVYADSVDQDITHFLNGTR